MHRRILFVCSGNQCRSPMAAKMFEKILKRELVEGIEVSSAGTLALNGDTVGEATKEVASSIGIDLSEHTSRPVTAELIRNSDLILVMEEIHKASILGLCPDLDDRVRLLRSFAPHSQPGEEIYDPIGLPPLALRTCFAQILESLEGLVKTIKDGKK